MLPSTLPKTVNRMPHEAYDHIGKNNIDHMNDTYDHMKEKTSSEIIKKGESAIAYVYVFAHPKYAGWQLQPVRYARKLSANNIEVKYAQAENN